MSGLPPGVSDGDIEREFGKEAEVYYLEYWTGERWELFSSYDGEDGLLDAERDTDILAKGLSVRLMSRKTGKQVWMALKVKGTSHGNIRAN